MKYLLLFLALIFVTGCSTDSNVASSSKGNLQVPNPGKWTRLEDYPVAKGILADIVLIAPMPYNGFNANVIVVSSKTDGVSLDQAVASEIQATQNDPSISSVIIDSSFTKSFDGSEGRILQMHITQNEFRLIGREIFLVQDGLGYQIIFIRHADDLASSFTFSQIEAGISFP